MNLDTGAWPRVCCCCCCCRSEAEPESTQPRSSVDTGSGGLTVNKTGQVTRYLGCQYLDTRPPSPSLVCGNLAVPREFPAHSPPTNFQRSFEYLRARGGGALTYLGKINHSAPLDSLPNGGGGGGGGGESCTDSLIIADCHRPLGCQVLLSRPRTEA